MSKGEQAGGEAAWGARGRTGGNENSVAEFSHLSTSEGRKDTWESLIFPRQTQDVLFQWREKKGNPVRKVDRQKGKLAWHMQDRPEFQGKLNTYCRCELAKVFHLKNTDNATTDCQGEGKGRDMCEILIQPCGI